MLQWLVFNFCYWRYWGVHKGAEHTMDISTADLEELSKTNVTVICAGAKSILDLPKTMEYLETKAFQLLDIKRMKVTAFFTHLAVLS